jgi:TonB family protein
MKPSIILLLVILLSFGGCTVPREATTSEVQLEVVRMTSLPPLKSFMSTNRLKVNLLVHVLQDGTVESVKMIGSSGDAEWDALATQSIKEWQFSIPRRDGVPTDVWARQVLVVQVEDPIVMTLGRLVTSSLHEADSLYALLEQGIVLDSSFRQTLETVDITTYPKRVRTELKRLDENDISRPLRLGETYMIFKRFPTAQHNSLPG